MPIGPRGERRPSGTIETAVKVARIATGEIPEDIADQTNSAAAAQLGRRGGRARADSLTPERRKQIARKAAIARWKKKRQ